VRSSPGASDRWILDDGPFNDLADFGLVPTLAGYPAGRLLVPGATAHAAKLSDARRVLLETPTLTGERLIQVITIGLGNDDPAGAILLELHGEERTTTNLAEREAIAWSLVHDKASIFVTYDSRAAIAALAELGHGRVAHPFDLWIDLLAEGALDVAQFKNICDRTLRRGSRLPRMPDRVTQLLQRDVPSA
jgi:hypothetical protein